MYLWQWDVSLDPIKQKVSAEMHIMQSNIVYNCSGQGGGNSSYVGMAAEVIPLDQN